MTSIAMTAPLLNISVQQIELIHSRQARTSPELMTMHITANSWCKADTAVAYLGHVCQLLSELVGLACGSLCTAVCLGTRLLAGLQLFDSHSQCLCKAQVHRLNAALHAHHVTPKLLEPGMCLPGHQQLTPNAGRSVTASPYVAHNVDLIDYAGLRLIWCDCASLATKSGKWLCMCDRSGAYGRGRNRLWVMLASHIHVQQSRISQTRPDYRKGGLNKIDA